MDNYLRIRLNKIRLLNEFLAFYIYRWFQDKFSVFHKGFLSEKILNYCILKIVYSFKPLPAS